MRRTERRRARGFTLVEVIVTMVVLGIVASMVAVFIVAPAQGYRDSVARAELSDLADTVLRRMGREIRLALPNSVRVSNDGQTIEFLETRTGGRYLAAADGADAAYPVLDFLRASSTTFRFIGKVPQDKEAISVGDLVVVYNLGSDFSPADAYTGGNSAAVTAVDTATQVITLASNPFAVQDPPMPSPTSRFQVVARAVRYVCNASQHTLTRLSGYTPVASVETGVSDGVSALAAARVSTCTFAYGDLRNRRTGLVSIQLGLQHENSTDAINLLYQVHVINTP